MDLEEKAELVATYIRKSDRIIHRKGHELAQNYGLTIEQYHLLFYLNMLERPPTIGEIAKKYCNAQNTMSEKISRLEEKQLVERKSDSVDRRVTRVIVSPKGKKLVCTIKKERRNKSVLKALNSMSEESIDNLIIDLETLYNNLSKEE